MTAQYSTVIQTHSKARIIALIIGIGLAMPLLFFGFLTAQQAMTRASDQAPQSVVVSGITKSSASIQWATDRESQAMVEYGTSPGDLNQFAPEASSVTDHEVKLTLLTPSTTYYFRIKVGDTEYDNAGVPWTFTTKTLAGEDVETDVKGVADQVKNLLLSPKPSTPSAGILQCSSMTCEQVRGNLGRGCSARDYVQCMAKQTAVSGIPGVTSRPSIAVTTVTPTPTTAVITSNTCKLDEIRADNSCVSWTWDTMATKYPSCQNAFSYYELECSNTSAVPAPGVTAAPLVRYFKNAIDDIEMNYVTLPEINRPTPAAGSTVYCRVRAVDKAGDATVWMSGSRQCQ
ncbi:MAG: fibronectin type III domain-containing protein [Weeksellaceae bacterium]